MASDQALVLQSSFGERSRLIDAFHEFEGFSTEHKLGADRRSIAACCLNGIIKRRTLCSDWKAGDYALFAPVLISWTDILM